METLRIAVFISGGGTNLQSLIDHIEKGKINGKIALVISSRENAYGLIRAKAHNIEGMIIGKTNYPNMDERENRMIEVLEDKEIDLIVLAGYLSILGKRVVERYKNRIINVHPALIPSFCGKGFHGEKVHQAVLDYGVKITGATVHFVDEGTDTGPIILQGAVAVQEEDSVEILGKKVLAVEHELLPKAVTLFAQGRLKVEGRKVRIIDSQRGYSF
ncbi:MAG: phosphoribosylglycinamide formyltransferase [Anaerosolibacter sp.]|jgi:phosphoribosylglycinamide formyltransferase-1|uniref:phosphoribosylglycinamide formyltransferase n=1 Tax=Anaerosolibacter sp. TaxID=1872527 RepID=UPI0026364D06|nr:phosphoribosylglycinamide formyltransferase [Anaerosolibacter sp.]MDF2546696.1 phosphoribosylglycinamide formyltransferase [Anaerosolibacter sp.]